MNLDRTSCYHAMRSRDRRFDGRFFVGVRTTGIYCRPVCPAPPPKLENVDFYACAAAAEDAGFRPCRRCRPETAPGTPAWVGSSAVVARALRLIRAGALDDGDVGALAQRLGIGARQMRRLFEKHLGAAPAAVARARRVHFARVLLDASDLPVTAVAFAAGFRSLRQFNHAVRASFGAAPRALRRRRAAAPAPGEPLTVRLPYRPPLDWDALLGFLALRVTPGVEAVRDGRYQRTVAIDDAVGAITVEPAAGAPALLLRVRLADEFGRAVDCGDGLTRLFPQPAVLADADVASIGVPRARAATVRALAAAVARGEPVLDASRGCDVAVARLRAIPGIGAWTAQYIAMRALGEPDAFPAGDLGVRKALGNGTGPLAAAEVERLADAWRPWRAYAVMHLWASLGSAGDQRSAPKVPSPAGALHKSSTSLGPRAVRRLPERRRRAALGQRRALREQRACANGEGEGEGMR